MNWRQTETGGGHCISKLRATLGSLRCNLPPPPVSWFFIFAMPPTSGSLVGGDCYHMSLNFAAVTWIPPPPPRPPQLSLRRAGRRVLVWTSATLPIAIQNDMFLEPMYISSYELLFFLIISKSNRTINSKKCAFSTPENKTSKPFPVYKGRGVANASMLRITPHVTHAESSSLQDSSPLKKTKRYKSGMQVCLHPYALSTSL